MDEPIPTTIDIDGLSPEGPTAFRICTVDQPYQLIWLNVDYLTTHWTDNFYGRLTYDLVSL